MLPARGSQIVNITYWFRLAGVAFALAAATPAAQAALVSYADDRSGFVANTGATSIGSFPTGVGPVGSLSVGGVTLTTDSGGLFFGNFSSRVPGNEMILSGPEDFHVTLPSGVFSIGFDLYEPTFGGASGCNTTTCVDDNFSVEVFAGSTSLGSFTYDAPDDDGTAPVAPLGFFGVHSCVAFNRVVVRDVTGNLDNEMFANFLKGSTPIPAVQCTTPAAGISWGRLKILYR